MAQIPKLIVQLVKIELASEGMQVEMRVASPEPAVGVFTPSRNLSRAPAASPRDRLRQPWTEPACRKVPQQSGSGEGPRQDNGAAGALVPAWRW
jgi:hypothetical protein